MQMETETLVFISYAREDRVWAERIYMDLRKQEINAWIDVRCLPAGANWKLEIKKAIRKSKYFILLLSKNSINKRGFVQNEIKEAIDVVKELPKGSIFLIPTRLDESKPIDDELNELNWVDLIPNYQYGLSRILSSLILQKSTPLIYSSGPPSISVDAIDKGKKISFDRPMILGERAPINYAPFRTKKEFIRQFLDSLPTASMFSDTSLSYYITLETTHQDIIIGDDLKEKYPESITLVLQNMFHRLEVENERFSVELYFNGVSRMISAPYDAIQTIRIPEIGIVIFFEQ
jgi:hypothetical protein